MIDRANSPSYVIRTRLESRRPVYGRFYLSTAMSQGEAVGGIGKFSGRGKLARYVSGTTAERISLTSPVVFRLSSC